MKTSIPFYLPLLALWLTLAGIVSAEETRSFKLTGKVRVKEGKHEFWDPHARGADTIKVLALPEDPRTLCAKTSAEGAAAIKQREGIEIRRYTMEGECVADPSGKFHIITSVEKMMPLGPGIVRVEERSVTGKLEVHGDPAKGQGGGELILHAKDGIMYRIPTKKFNDKPSGLDYITAAKLEGQQIELKASVQIYPEPPHRVAKVITLVPVKSPDNGAAQKGWQADPDQVEARQAKADAANDKLNFHEEKVPEYQLPNPLIFQDGTPVKTVADWNNRKRPETLNMFRENVYGIRPTTPYMVTFEEVDKRENAMGFGATAKQVRAFIKAAKGTYKFDFVLVIPKSNAPVPLVVLINNRSSITLDQAENGGTSFWPVKTLVSKGYATACFRTSDVDPDDKRDGYKQGIRVLLDAQDSDPMTRWHSISAWAWGASRVLDYCLEQSEIDAKRTAIAGHSRGGKTALWAGAEDMRFQLVYSNDSGCGGAALSRRSYGESVARINKSFPHWFCGNFSHFDNNEKQLPVDQHQLIALIAPRAVYVASADRDIWADPRGEYASVVHAGPVYELFGLKHITNPLMPPLDTPQHIGKTGYHIRAGTHNLEERDWKYFLKFADGVFKR